MQFSRTLLAVLATFFVAEAQVSLHNPNYCYSTDPIRPQNGMHTTQASYEAIRRYAVDPFVSSEFDFHILISSTSRECHLY